MMQKYIIINGQPILFPAEIIHADMVDNILSVESAGFFVIVKDGKNRIWEVVCMGESTSLAIHSRPELDQQIIKTFLRLWK
jgi:hypothetical protein